MRALTISSPKDKLRRPFVRIRVFELFNQDGKLEELPEEKPPIKIDSPDRIRHTRKLNTLLGKVPESDTVR